MQIVSYLYFPGTCREAFTFYQQVLGGNIVAMITHAETPMSGHSGPEWEKCIVHARLIVGDAVLMGSDAPPEYYSKPGGYSVSLMLNDTAEAERIYAALSENGEVGMALQETFWAHRFAMFTDRFGTSWMFNYEKPMG